MAIRITRKDRDMIRKINNNVRAKERRLKNNYGITSDFKTKNVTSFKSRSELKEYVRNANSFTRGYGNKYRKNKYGFVASLYDIAQARHATARANKERKRQLDKFKLEEFKSRGKSTGFTALDRMLMGDSRYSSFEPIKFNFNSIRNQRHFDKRLENIINSSTKDHFDKKNEILKQNILKSIEQNWGNLGKEAYEFIKDKTSDEVAKLFLTEDVFDFEVFGSPQNLGDIAKNIERFYMTFNLGIYGDLNNV